MAKKTAKTRQNCYVAEKRVVSKLLKISILNLNSTNLRLESRLYLYNNQDSYL